MADVAVGRNCSRCGTFTACAGSFADAELAGTCGCCGSTVTAQAHGGERKHAQVAAGIGAFARGESSNDPGLPPEPIAASAPESAEPEAAVVSPVASTTPETEAKTDGDTAKK